jgi:predicted peroxiredoxin
LSKDKYQISKKADYVGLKIILNELQSFQKDIHLTSKDKDSLSFQMRSTLNVFIPLHNLKDAINKIRINGDSDFVAKTRKLRKDLEFISHVRNKGAGHIDQEILERAVQWHPHIFKDTTSENNEYLTYECYRAVIESGINSYICKGGIQKVFETEIDLLYPPTAKQFYCFMAELISTGIEWIYKTLEILKSEINFYSDEQVIEYAAVAAKTSFNLKGESPLDFDALEAENKLKETIEAIKNMGADPKIIEFMEKKFLPK